MIYEYQWRVPKYPVEAKTAGEHIESLDKLHGEVTPTILLDSSRPANATLHPCFEWNDEVAAEKYRTVQAKDILGNLVYVAISESKNEKTPAPTRAFVNVSSRNKSGSYRPIMTAMKNEETRKIVLKNALKELEMFGLKYESLTELSGVFEAIGAAKIALSST